VSRRERVSRRRAAARRLRAEGRSYREIAATLKVGLATVKRDLDAGKPEGGPPPPEQGNARAVQHGAFFESAIEPLRAQLVVELSARYPNEPAESVHDHAHREAQIALLRGYEDRKGSPLSDEHGNVYNSSKFLRQLVADSAKWRRDAQLRAPAPQEGHGHGPPYLGVLSHEEFERLEELLGRYTDTSRRRGDPARHAGWAEAQVSDPEVLAFVEHAERRLEMAREIGLANPLRGADIPYSDLTFEQVQELLELRRLCGGEGSAAWELDGLSSEDRDRLHDLVGSRWVRIPRGDGNFVGRTAASARDAREEQRIIDELGLTMEDAVNGKLDIRGLAERGRPVQRPEGWPERDEIGPASERLALPPAPPALDLGPEADEDVEEEIEDVEVVPDDPPPASPEPETYTDHKGIERYRSNGQPISIKSG
jgi:hypothetical protein